MRDGEFTVSGIKKRWLLQCQIPIAAPMNQGYF